MHISCSKSRTLFQLWARASPRGHLQNQGAQSYTENFLHRQYYNHRSVTVPCPSQLFQGISVPLFSHPSVRLFTDMFSDVACQQNALLIVIKHHISADFQWVDWPFCWSSVSFKILLLFHEVKSTVPLHHYMFNCGCYFNFNGSLGYPKLK